RNRPVLWFPPARGEFEGSILHRCPRTGNLNRSARATPIQETPSDCRSWAALHTKRR
ncbi:hypothetical protein HPB47_011223, partial [Ixodes persulcatus]